MISPCLWSRQKVWLKSRVKNPLHPSPEIIQPITCAFAAGIMQPLLSCSVMKSNSRESSISHLAILSLQDMVSSLSPCNTPSHVWMVVVERTGMVPSPDSIFVRSCPLALRFGCLSPWSKWQKSPTISWETFSKYSTDSSRRINSTQEEAIKGICLSNCWLA